MQCITPEFTNKTDYFFNDLILVQYQSKDWFEKNAFKDHHDHYWPTEELARKYYNAGLVFTTKDECILSSSIGKIKLIYEIVYDSEKWGIKEVLSKKDYPEYLI